MADRHAQLTHEAPTTNALAFRDDPLWYKDAVVYELHVKAFFDANGDGLGDFRGLHDKLDYVQDLGVNTVWLLPFYPSPLRDDGYDIADYRGVHADYGRLRDFRAFVREAHRRDLKVITELVINHTSDQHPWFQAARRAPPGSAKRDFYVWSDNDERYAETRIIFTDTESSNWAWDPVARAYYWHRFFSHQPDLNFDNPQVLKAVLRTMCFWFDMGVDGMRLDAIPYLIERDGTNNENLPETHTIIREMRRVVDQRYQGRMFLAEANQWPEDVREYFGDGDQCHVAYHFPLMPRMYMAIAQEDRHPIVEIMRQTPEIPDSCQWAIFLRNHDELTLEMVTDAERDYMYRTYASDPRARINLGIRRRLAPLMDNDLERIKLMKSLLFSMPGSPIIYYGDEIGMGDTFFLGDRNGVRTPMQWSPDRNAGFSRADPQRLYLPPIMDPIYGYEAVNVEAQSRDPSSLLNWTKRILAVRKTQQAFGRGTIEFLRPGNRKILAYVREHQGTIILCVANLARTAQPVELDLSRFRGRAPVEMMGLTTFPPIGDLPYLLTLPGHGFYWFRLAAEAEVPAWHAEALPPLDPPVLVLYDGWWAPGQGGTDVARRGRDQRLRHQIEREVLPLWLANKRWYAAKAQRIEQIRLDALNELRDGRDVWWLGAVTVTLEGGESQTYFLPLGIAWENGDEELVRSARPATLAKVRYKARVGVLFDAFVDPAFCRALVHAIGARREIEFAGGRLVGEPTLRFEELAGAVLPAEIRQPGIDGTNTSVILGDRLFLKAYRRLQPGVNLEIEMGRFLTDVAAFPNVVPLAGGITWVPDAGPAAALGMLQGYVKNQGDGWSWTIDYLLRFLDESRLQATEEAHKHRPVEPVPVTSQPHGHYALMVRTLGRRIGELHATLARTTGDPAFDPEPVSAKELASWRDQVRDEARATLDRLAAARPNLPESQAALAARLLGAKRALLNSIGTLLPDKPVISKTRYHGDLHLGQVLIAENDFLIIDFEGEPARPLDARRAKASALRDVAGMLRSFSYAAAVAVKRFTAERPWDAAVIEPLADTWARSAGEALLEGYREGVRGSVVWPRRKEHAQRLITLFTIEKAFYELRYELDNRPDWADVPLRGLIALAGTGGHRSSKN
ncbi:MAG: maltose alpha-D-glucosyltransferase [Gammaproteobacteria bacterium]|nr:maltose alpha-D-glucosyltransferase [Gammaproteobacteria bacterium]